MKCSEALPLMHEYLDGERDNVQELKQHLSHCPSCSKFFAQLEITEAMARRLPEPAVPAELKANIMNRLPTLKKQARWLLWIKAHPALSVASVFLLVIISSFMALLREDKDMVIRGANLDQLIVQGNTVIVPEGHTIRGDLTVIQGTIQVDGSVEGDITVINGSYNLASTAYISGQITLVDETLEWIKYRIRSIIPFLKVQSFIVLSAHHPDARSFY